MKDLVAQSGSHVPSGSVGECQLPGAEGRVPGGPGEHRASETVQEAGEQDSSGSWKLVEEWQEEGQRSVTDHRNNVGSFSKK